MTGFLQLGQLTTLFFQLSKPVLEIWANSLKVKTHITLQLSLMHVDMDLSLTQGKKSTTRFVDIPK
jgi:hypothetical protein